MILVIDNYDSFAYNLAQRLGELGEEPMVFRNDTIDIKSIEEMQPSHIVISPGPGTPLNTGISNDVILHFAGRLPILGVCLGHQCIGHSFGGIVDRADIPIHGKASLIKHDGKSIYEGIENPFTAGRYHSLIVKEKNFPDSLLITARSTEGEIMGIRHKRYVVEGTQVHPESILTEAGYTMLSNFIKISSAVW